jgi:hypothetical protein
MRTIENETKRLRQRLRRLELKRLRRRLRWAKESGRFSSEGELMSCIERTRARTSYLLGVAK